MKTNYREKALRLELEARQVSGLSRYLKYKNYRGDASELYEKAGDTWLKQAGAKRNLRDIKNSLSYALNDYDSAMKLAETIEEKQRMQNKKKSTRKTISSFKISSGGLEKKFVFATLSMAFLLSALFSVSFSLTGYAVGGLVQENSRWIGLCLFVCGLVFAFCYFKSKK